MSNRFVPPREHGPTAALAVPGGHEFSATDDAVFAGLARAMRVVAVFLQCLGTLDALRGILGGLHVEGITTFVEGAVQLVVGIWLLLAAKSLTEITTTRGDDLGALMQAMRQLRKVYVLQAWVIALGLLAGVAALVLTR